MEFVEEDRMEIHVQITQIVIMSFIVILELSSHFYLHAKDKDLHTSHAPILSNAKITNIVGTHLKTRKVKTKIENNVFQCFLSSLTFNLVGDQIQKRRLLH